MAQVRRSQIAIAKIRVAEALTRTKMLDLKDMELGVTLEIARLFPQSIQLVSELLQEVHNLEKRRRQR